MHVVFHERLRPSLSKASMRILPENENLSCRVYPTFFPGVVKAGGRQMPMPRLTDFGRLCQRVSFPRSPLSRCPRSVAVHPTSRVMQRRRPSSVLCLACSGDVRPPQRVAASSTSRNTNDNNNQTLDAFLAPCCARPICATCLKANPRLARYDPCLACLRLRVRSGGAGTSGRDGKGGGEVVAPKEEERFAIGLDDEDDEDDGEGGMGGRRTEADMKDSSAESDPPPPYELEATAPPRQLSNETTDLDHSESSQTQNSQPVHHVQRTDTLRGLALKYGVDVRRLISLFSIQTCSSSSWTCIGPNLVSAEQPASKHTDNDAPSPPHSHHPYPPLDCKVTNPTKCCSP